MWYLKRETKSPFRQSVRNSPKNTDSSGLIGPRGFDNLLIGMLDSRPPRVAFAGHVGLDLRSRNSADAAGPVSGTIRQAG